MAILAILIFCWKGWLLFWGDDNQVDMDQQKTCATKKISDLQTVCQELILLWRQKLGSVKTQFLLSIFGARVYGRGHPWHQVNRNEPSRRSPFWLRFSFAVCTGCPEFSRGHLERWHGDIVFWSLKWWIGTSQVMLTFLETGVSNEWLECCRVILTETLYKCGMIRSCSLDPD